jgi:UDP-glucose 4-epimerase
MPKRQGAPIKLLLVGGAGFIGAEITARLLKRGHAVRVLDRNIKRFPSRQILKSKNDEFEVICGNYANCKMLEKALSGVDVVIHLASSTVPQSSNLDSISDVKGNVIASLRLLQACRERGVKKIVFTSSGGTVYGISQTIPMSEDNPTNPISSYGITKLMIEKYLQLFYHLYGLDYSILRCANAYGPGQNFISGQGAVGIFMRRMIMGESIIIWGDGSIVRDYVYVDDLAEAHILAANSKRHATIVNIGSGIGTSLNNLVHTIAKAINVIPVVEYSEARKFDVPNNILKIDRAKQVFNWAPKIDLETGVELTWKALSEEMRGRNS